MPQCPAIGFFDFARNDNAIYATNEFENSCAPLILRGDVRTLIALEDGRYFEGESFGATGTCVGEICFNTAMTGYQEVLTDPSYRGQIVAMTYPLIGNYGINSLDQESRSPHVRGFVIEELTDVPSNWRSEMSLDEYLRKWNIPGAKGIDTRALTRHLRTRGAMKACLTTEDISPEEATQTSDRRRGRDRDGLRTRSLNEKNLSLGPRGQIQRAMVDPKIAGRAGTNEACHRSAFELPHTITASKKIFCGCFGRKVSR